jgi:hypothetical protein
MSIARDRGPSVDTHLVNINPMMIAQQREISLLPRIWIYVEQQRLVLKASKKGIDNTLSRA